MALIELLPTVTADIAVVNVLVAFDELLVVDLVGVNVVLAISVVLVAELGVVVVE